MKYTPLQYAESLYEALKGKQGVEYTQVIQNFLHIVRKNHDYNLLNRIVRGYEKVFLARNGLKKVEVASASPLSENIKTEIKKIMGNALILEETINQELGAGITITVNDSLYIDASARTRIHNLFA